MTKKYRAFELYTGRNETYRRLGVYSTREEAMIALLMTRAFAKIHEHTAENWDDLAPLFETAQNPERFAYDSTQK